MEEARGPAIEDAVALPAGLVREGAILVWGLDSVAVYYLEKKFKPIDASSGYSIASLCLPGHLIPATFFNDLRDPPLLFLCALGPC